MAECCARLGNCYKDLADAVLAAQQIAEGLLALLSLGSGSTNQHIIGAPNCAQGRSIVPTDGRPSEQRRVRSLTF